MLHPSHLACSLLSHHCYTFLPTEILQPDFKYPVSVTGSEILLYLQTNKLACYCFMDNRRHKTLGPNTKDFVTHGIASNKIIVLAWVSMSPCPMGVTQRYHVNSAHLVSLWCSWGTLNLEDSLLYSKWKQAYFLCRGRCHSIPQGCLLQAQL